MDKNINIAPKEIAPGVFSTGGTATMPTVNPIQPNVITPQALQSVAPLNVQTPPELQSTTPNIAGDMAFLQNLQNQQTAEQQALTQQKESADTGITNLLKEISGQGQEQLSLEQQFVNPINTQLTDLSGQIGSQIAEYQQAEKLYEKAKSDIEVGAGRKGITTSAVMGQQGAIDRAKASELNVKASNIGILQAQALALQGKADLAQKQIDRAIDLKYKGKEQELAIRKFQLDSIEENLSAEEKKKAEALNFALNKEEKRVAEQKENEKAIENMLIQAQANQAPNSVLAKAQELAKKGASRVDIAKSLGQYSLSVADRLDIRLKETQINKLNQEMSQLKKVVPDAGDLVKINGKDYIRYKDGTISEPVVPEAGDRGMVVTRLDEKLKTVGKLTKPSVGLSTSAGSLRGAPIPFLYKNAINDWRADAVNIIQKLTVDELGRVKSDGVTFGALSNGERQAVGEAATALGAASIKDKEGNPTGRFKMSEKKVRDEFQKIYDGYALDFERRAGVPYETYQQNPEALKVQAVDDFIDNTGTALQANYGNYPTN